jgi:hypothetical protein
MASSFIRDTETQRKAFLEKHLTNPLSRRRERVRVRGVEK